MSELILQHSIFVEAEGPVHITMYKLYIHWTDVVLSTSKSDNNIDLFKQILIYETLIIGQLWSYNAH